MRNPIDVLLEQWRKAKHSTEFSAARDLVDAYSKGMNDARGECADELARTLQLLPEGELHASLCQMCAGYRVVIERAIDILRSAEPTVAVLAEPSHIGPVHVVDEGRYRAVVKNGIPLIERADTAGAVRSVEGW